MTEPDNDFARQAASPRQGNVAGEMFSFLKQSKKWWLLPVVVAVLTLGVLVLLGGTAAAPFIYTLF